MAYWFDNLSDERRDKILAVLDGPDGAECVRHAEGDRGYACWLLVCDATCRKIKSLSIFDLADQCWSDLYRDGVEPRDAVALALANEC